MSELATATAQCQNVGSINMSMLDQQHHVISPGDQLEHGHRTGHIRSLSRPKGSDSS